MMHKIRSVMGLRDDQYLLKGGTEIDEGYFESVNFRQQSGGNKREEAVKKQTKVLVMAAPKKQRSPVTVMIKKENLAKVGFLKIKVIKSLKSKGINDKIENSIELGSDTLSDNYSSYSKITDKVNHTKMNVDKGNIHKILPLVYITIRNAKRFFARYFP